MVEADSEMVEKTESEPEVVETAKPEKDEKIRVIFLRRHWKMCALIVAGAILACVSAILVFIWFAGNAQSTGLVPMTLDLWAMGHLVGFILHLIFWEVLLIVVPVIIAVAAVYMLWWKKLPKAERDEYKRRKLFGKGSMSFNSSGGTSFLIFLGLMIKVYLDGNWNVPFSTWTFDYLVSSIVWIFIVCAIIFGIPIAIGVILWIRWEMKK